VPAVPTQLLLSRYATKLRCPPDKRERRADREHNSLESLSRSGRPQSGSSPLCGLVTWFARRRTCQGDLRSREAAASLTCPPPRDTRTCRLVERGLAKNYCARGSHPAALSRCAPKLRDPPDEREGALTDSSAHEAALGEQARKVD
jgi:hypothetical protein